MTVFYIDVSHHDRNRRGGPLDWAAIRKYTAPVMVARATYGDPSGWHRPSYYHGEMQTSAKAAGFDVRGSYHNLVKGDTASIARQVDWLRREMDRYGCVWAMVDVERYPELVSADMWPRWDDVQQFCARWHAVDDRVLTAYIPGWLYSGYYAGKDVAALGVPLVESDYGSNPGGLPADTYATRGGDDGRGWAATGNLTPSVWQYSSEGDLPGASGKTDYNAFRGSLAQLRTLLTGGNDMALTTADKPIIQQAVMDALRQAVPYGASGPGGRLKEAGWSDLSALGILAYGMEHFVDGRTLTEAVAVRAEVAAMRAVVEQLAAAVTAGGGTVDTAAILAGVDQRLAAVRADMRDAVADLGEGGAAQVRAPQS